MASDATRTLDDWLAEIHSAGLRLNNLFELPDGRWQANVTDGELNWEFGRGLRWEIALAEALAKARAGPGIPIIRPPQEAGWIKSSSEPRASSRSETRLIANASPEDLGL